MYVTRCNKLSDMLNSKWLKHLWTNFLKIYNSTINFASIFIKVMQLSMFSIQISRKKILYTKFWISRNFLVTFKFFLQIKVVPIIYEWGKVEKVRSNLSKITVNFWTVWVWHSGLFSMRQAFEWEIIPGFRCKLAMY